MTIALYIIGSLAACYVLYVFGYGAIITLGAEYEWTRGRRIRGSKAVLLGVAMMFSFPLFATIGWGMGKLNLIGDSWLRLSVAALVTAAICWSALRGITRKLNSAEE